MGVRHKTLLVEGVQFHPESILTAEGRTMLKKFLKMEGGTWDENDEFQRRNTSHSLISDTRDGPTTDGHALNGLSQPAFEGKQKGSILEQIFAHRKAAVDSQKQVPSQRFSDFQSSYNLNLAPPQISFPQRLRMSPYPLSLMAEIKRASPSKGDIAPFICAPTQAKKYALAGASCISVLTEPKWFKGSIDDLRAVRQSLEGMPNRPAVLRKEFILDEYQILEARLAGADTVLLIVKMVSEDTLKKLYLYSQSLGMEPLVEVNTLEEMKVAIKLGAQVIGVNNRNLASFEVDLETTSRLMEGVPKETIVCALSGISGPNDVVAYEKNGVGAVLVGEALMRADDTAAFIENLLGSAENRTARHRRREIMVKICGTRTPEAAKVAIASGADLIGIILVEGRTRCVSREVALAISRVVHNTPKPAAETSRDRNAQIGHQAVEFFDHTSSFFRRFGRASLVGVFRNQPLSYILAQQELLDLDIVQLHGSEPLEWATLIPVPVIRRFCPDDTNLCKRGYHALPLLDTAAGGTGQMLDPEAIKALLRSDAGLRIVFAGGLEPENVKAILNAIGDCSSQIVAVDVSSGVEEDGEQSHVRIRDFIKAAKGISRG